MRDQVATILALALICLLLVGLAKVLFGEGWAVALAICLTLALVVSAIR